MSSSWSDHGAHCNKSACVSDGLHLYLIQHQSDSSPEGSFIMNKQIPSSDGWQLRQNSVCVEFQHVLQMDRISQMCKCVKAQCALPAITWLHMVQVVTTSKGRGSSWKGALGPLILTPQETSLLFLWQHSTSAVLCHSPHQQLKTQTQLSSLNLAKIGMVCISHENICIISLSCLILLGLLRILLVTLFQNN